MLVLLFLAAGLAGLLGPGLLSWTSASSDDVAVRIDYQRFAHLEADDLVTITVDATAVTSDSVGIGLSRDWVDAVDIQSIVPQPDSGTSTPAELRLQLSARPGSAVTVRITYRASAVGVLNGVVRQRGSAVSFAQLVYP